MTLDVMFPVWNRKAFTRAAWAALIQNTNWELADSLTVYDDGSTDGTREWIEQHLGDCPVPASIVHLGYGSPVAAMRYHAAHSAAGWFAKIDNDILCPPGWLDAMVDTVARNPGLDCLGMEAGRMGVPYRDGWEWDGIYRVEPCSHIGGVGLIRTVAVHTLKMKPDGRFGWTEAQQSGHLNRAWITPDLAVPQLDRLPFEPWLSLSDFYIEQGWQRRWPPYSERWMAWYWQPWFPDQELPA